MAYVTFSQKFYFFYTHLTGYQEDELLSFYQKFTLRWKSTLELKKSDGKPNFILNLIQIGLSCTRLIKDKRFYISVAIYPISVRIHYCIFLKASNMTVMAEKNNQTTKINRSPLFKLSWQSKEKLLRHFSVSKKHENTDIPTEMLLASRKMQQGNAALKPDAVIIWLKYMNTSRRIKSLCNYVESVPFFVPSAVPLVHTDSSVLYQIVKLCNC